MGYAKIIYIYEDGISSAQYSRSNWDDLKSDVGNATLEACFGSGKAQVKNHFNCINCCGEVHSADSNLYLWFGNCLRSIYSLNDKDFEIVEKLVLEERLKRNKEFQLNNQNTNIEINGTENTIKLIDLVDKKIPFNKKDSFMKSYPSINFNESTNDFFNNLINKPWHVISEGINLIGSLEIKENNMEKKLIEYAKELILSSDFLSIINGKVDIFESILWNLGKIGTKDSINFIEESINKYFLDKYKHSRNYNHIISASQFSYLLLSKNIFISDDNVKTFFDKTMPFRGSEVDQEQINIQKELDPIYADYLQYIYDNYR